MKVKILTALMMTVVMTFAAYASEQRRMCHETAVADDEVVVTIDGREATIIAMNIDVTN